MIVTLTPNPSIDRTVVLGSPLVRGDVHRIESVSSQAAGKGVNISRAAVAAGVPTVAVLPAHDDDPYVQELKKAGLVCHIEEPSGDVRVNLTITEPDGTTTKLNSPGPEASLEMRERLERTLLGLAGGSRWVVLAGSLPPGCPPGWYADLVHGLAGRGGQVAVDTSDDALVALVAGLERAAPALMKPNDSELAGLCGLHVADLRGNPAATASAARTLVDRGVGAVLATLGGAGAVLVTPEGAWHATPPPITVVSTVGAGDSSLFGYLYADIAGAPAEERLRTAVAWGSAAASLPGTTIPVPDQTRPDQVSIREIDLPREMEGTR